MINTFNITLNTLRDRGNLTFTEVTSPSSSGAIEILNESAQEVSNQARSMGISIDNIDSSDNNYFIFRSMILYRTLEKIYIVRDRGGTEGSQRYSELYDELLKTLRNSADVFQKGNITSTVSSAQRIKDKYREVGIENPWQNSTAGRISRRIN